MRKFFFFTGIFIISGLLILSELSPGKVREEEEKEIVTSVDTVYAKMSTETQKEFLIADRGGFLMVYDTSTGRIFEKTKIRTESLPEKLREKIRRGYRIRGVMTLYSFMENYSS
ncbi:MAG: hypothetical protein MRZ74_06430 [Blautia sp.]|nr:hypothetical protein [Blautia sp.]MDY5031948.1 hypothetical protein [Blautia sp.]